MFEGYLFCMEMEADGFLVAVERIAEDGRIQSFLMGTMHSELVGSAGFRIESYSEMGIVDMLQYFILRNRLLALSMIHYLAGTV